MCCLQEVRWRECGARLIGVQGRRYKLWWSGNYEGHGGVGVLVKEELYDKVVEVRKVNYRVMSLAIVLEDEVEIVVLAYAPQGSKSMKEIEFFLSNQIKPNFIQHSTKQTIIIIFIHI